MKFSSEISYNNYLKILNLIWISSFFCYIPIFRLYLKRINLKNNGNVLDYNLFLLRFNISSSLHFSSRFHYIEEAE